MAGHGAALGRGQADRAGCSLILFNNASLWHSGTLNYSPALRLAVTTGITPGGGCVT